MMTLSSTPSVTTAFDHDHVRIYPRIRWSEDDPWIERCFTWTDRASYLAWVTDWKQQLAARVADVRTQIQARRNPKLDDDQRAAAQSKRQLARVQCANLLLLRRLGKQRATRERQARVNA